MTEKSAPEAGSHSNWKALGLIAISVLSSILGFGLSIYLARLLGPTGFQEFLVAIAALSLFGALCEFGVGKYAMRVLPDSFEEKDWASMAGFVRFGLNVVIVLSCIVMCVVVGWQYFFYGEVGNNLLFWAVMFLPASAVMAVLSEFVMANRAPLRGALITKLICPIATLGLLAGAQSVYGSITAKVAIICFGLAGVIGLFVAIFLYLATSPNKNHAEKPRYKLAEWLRHCAWYFVLAFVMSWIFDIGVIVLELAQIADVEIARFGAAYKTGCLILLVAKSTNKFYSPEMSIIMSEGNWDTGLRLRKVRLSLIALVCGLFVLAMTVFGKSLLGMFGPEYKEGYVCLIFVSIGASVATVFALAPEYLKFSGKLRQVLAIQVVTAVLLAVLTWVLGVWRGANGAGAAFAIVMVLSTAAFLVLTQRQLRIHVAKSKSDPSD